MPSVEPHQPSSPAAEPIAEPHHQPPPAEEHQGSSPVVEQPRYTNAASSEAPVDHPAFGADDAREYAYAHPFEHTSTEPLRSSSGEPAEMLMPMPEPLVGHEIKLAQLKEELIAWVKTLVSAAVYAILIVTFLFQIARVEGQSMAPTLEDQDRLIVNKLVYRLGEPHRGDIVMLYYPLNPDKSFVKRVIAEEGDTVRIVDGKVYLNDMPLHDDYVPPQYRSHDEWGPQVIPEGYYFVMGDHRNNSSDSRHWGMVPKKYIIGKVQLRWWPVPSARLF